MPDMPSSCKQVLWLLKHVWGRDLEGILRVKIVKCFVLGVRKPDFLEKNDLGLKIAEYVLQI